jgi:hypothetical protein
MSEVFRNTWCAAVENIAGLYLRAFKIISFCKKNLALNIPGGFLEFYQYV